MLQKYFEIWIPNWSFFTIIRLSHGHLQEIKSWSYFLLVPSLIDFGEQTTPMYLFSKGVHVQYYAHVSACLNLFFMMVDGHHRLQCSCYACYPVDYCFVQNYVLIPMVFVGLDIILIYFIIFEHTDASYQKRAILYYLCSFKFQ